MRLIKKSKLRRRIIHVFSVLALVGVYIGSLSLYWMVRGKGYEVNSRLEYNHYDAVNDGLHNSNTDMIWWNGEVYLIHASSPYHVGSEKCKLVIWNSTDFQDWNKIVEKPGEPGEDIRDPKFAIIGSRLYLYALKNYVDDPIASPYTTVFSYTEDGTTWTDWVEIDNYGWLFWRPKTNDNVTWYVPAYWHEHGRSALFSSTNGENWTLVSEIFNGEGNDETAIEFLSNGSLICTARLEYHADTGIGSINAGTLLAVSDPPFTTWYRTKDKVSRLDGPYLFTLNNTVFAVGRYQPEIDIFFTQSGSIFSRKRTAIYMVEPDKLTYLTDLPSCGDTSYPGVVVRGDDVYICYYTSNLNKDLPWVWGMFAPSVIHVVNATVDSIFACALHPNSPVKVIPWDGYIVLGCNIAFSTWVFSKVIKKNKLRAKESLKA
ncbi:MAG: sialidase family protein [Promethearchaeota archaeon]